MYRFLYISYEIRIPSLTEKYHGNVTMVLITAQVIQFLPDLTSRIGKEVTISTFERVTEIYHPRKVTKNCPGAVYMYLTLVVKERFWGE